MLSEKIDRYDQRVPRYTSYPTAPHFHAGIGPDSYADWLGFLPADEPLSLYLHVPFCRELCLYCGCHTTVVRGHKPITAYAKLIGREIDLVASHLGSRRPAPHIHWGGGTPTILEPSEFLAIMRQIGRAFATEPDAEIAIEIDPRTIADAQIAALAEAGVNRASLGVQDFDPTVQRAVNRIQPYEMTARVAEGLREAGIGGINLDLMYGLPHQTETSVARSVSLALDLDPDRIALFGYAHVPWMKRHQSLLPEACLPGARERFAQMLAATEIIRGAGYIAIGLDHFAKPHDHLAVALGTGELRRNFQGYTTDRATTLIGFGTSSIGALPQGYVQNAARTVDYRDAISAGRLATVRGIALGAEDRLRRAIIERLMCNLTVDVARIASDHGADPDQFATEFARIDEFASDGIAERHGYRIAVPDCGRPFLRNVCAAFDTQLAAGSERHSRAI